MLVAEATSRSGTTTSHTFGGGAAMMGGGAVGGKTTGSHPKWRGEAAAEGGNHTTTGAATSGAAGGGGGGGESNWEVVPGRDGSASFYHNPSTGISSWLHPVTGKEAPRVRGGEYEHCGVPSCTLMATEMCTVCRVVFYCSQEHQRSHWTAHEVECRRSRAVWAAEEEGVPGRDWADQLIDRRPDSGDPGEQIPTQDRYVTIVVKMKDEGGFDSNMARCGPFGLYPLWYVLGVKGDAHDEDAVQLILGMASVNVNRTDPQGRSVLWLQCNYGRSRNVKLLLADPRVDVNLVDLNGETPLAIATGENNYRCVRLLLADGRLDPNIRSLGHMVWVEMGAQQVRSTGGATALYVAVNHGKVRIVQLLLADSRVDINLADEDGDTPLHIAANMDLVSSAAILLSDNRVDPNRTNALGATPLHIATNLGNVQCLQLFLRDPRIDPNQPDLMGFTPLNILVNNNQQCKEVCIKLLLADERVDPNQANSKRHTPLLNAVSQREVRAVELLLGDSRVDPNLGDGGHGCTPLCLAADQGYCRIVELFLADERVDVSQSGVGGWTPLLHACIPLMRSMDQVGLPEGNDPTRALVIMLKSRRIPAHNLKESIALLRNGKMPTQHQVDIAEAGGKPLTPIQKMARFVLPILQGET